MNSKELPFEGKAFANDNPYVFSVVRPGDSYIFNTEYIGIGKRFRKENNSFFLVSFNFMRHW